MTKLKSPIRQSFPMNSRHQAAHKIVVLGKGAVGKTATLLQFTRSTFPLDHGATIEDQFNKQCVIDQISTHLDIFDTSGQDEFVSLRDDNIRRVEGFLVVFSVTDRHSFDEVESIRNTIVRVKEKNDFPMILAGNKVDLTRERVVSREEAEQRVRSYGSTFCRYVETSARTGENIELAFSELVRLMRVYRQYMDQRPDSNNRTSNSCCVLL